MSEFPLFDAEPVRPEEELDKVVWQPSWRCFCCQDSGKISPNLVRRVIPGYNYERDRIPICQACNKHSEIYHLKEFGVLDTRFDFQLCRKLDAVAREDWRLSAQAWFEMAKQRIEQSTGEIAQEHNLRKRDRISAEFILAKEKHGRERGDWEEFKEKDEDKDEDKEVVE